MPLSGNLLLNPSTLAFEIVHWILYSLLHRQPVVHTRFTKFTLNIWIDGGIQDVDMTFLIVLWGWNPEKMMWAVTKCLCWFNSTLQKVMSSVVCFLSLDFPISRTEWQWPLWTSYKGSLNPSSITHWMMYFMQKVYGSCGDSSCKE